MPVTEKLVDSDFLSRLIAGSMESAIGAVDEAVAANAGLFNAEGESVRTMATYSDHVIVVNEDGEFFRAKWKLTDDGVVISEAEEIDVPVYEVKAMGKQVRQESIAAVRAMLANDLPGAEDKVRGMYRLVKSGIRLTAEGVEDLYHQHAVADSDWFKAVQEQGDKIRSFIGTESIRISRRPPRFEALLDDGVTESQAEPQRAGVAASLAQLSGELVAMRSRIALARQVTEGHRPRDAAEGDMTASDFVEFVAGFGEDLDAMIGLLGDAQAVSEDGCIKCLARLHDGVSSQMYEWSLATAFCEKLARRFVLAAA